MPSVSKTTNLQLNQYTDTDIFNPLQDYNSDMRKIDEAFAQKVDAPRTYMCATEPPDWRVGDSWLDTSNDDGGEPVEPMEPPDEPPDAPQILVSGTVLSPTPPDDKSALWVKTN